MRMLVTGGAGFIGSHLVDALLCDGHEVRVLDSLDPQVHEGNPSYLSPEAELVRADVRDREIVRRCFRDADVLVHLAAAVGVGQSMYEIERYMSMNTLGAAVVLEEAVAARERLTKMVVASSMSIYGEGLYRCGPEDQLVSPPPRTEAQLRARRWDPLCPGCGAPLEPVPTTESTPITPESIYAIGKRDHEEMFLVSGRAYGIATTALRFFNVYGPRQSLSNPYTGVAAIFSSRLMSGNAPVIFEDGAQSRDFIHVSDIVAAIVAALASGAADGEAVNVGTGRSVSVREVADVLARHLGVDLEPEVRNQFRAGDIRHCFASVDKAKQLLEFAPSTSFEDGMLDLISWLSEATANDRVNEATEALERRGLTL